MSYTPLANGIRTDHPTPGLPFVDDAILDLDDRFQIESIGRDKGEDMWGREDLLHGSDTDWSAVTTIPSHPHLAWLVRHIDGHGTTVELVLDDDLQAAHTPESHHVLTRGGGYAWDGTTWTRPGTSYDRVTHETTSDPVPEAETITVADVLQHHHPHEPKPLTELDDISTALPKLTTEVTSAWVANHLSAWLRVHTDPETWARATVTLTAPELERGQMLTVAAVADYAGLSQGSIRAYLARAQMPAPQTRDPVIMWSRPVIAHWREAVATKATPAVEMTESESDLSSIGTDLAALAKGLNRGRWGRGRRKLTPVQIEASRSVLARHTMGLSNRNPWGKADALAQLLADGLHPVTLTTGPAFHLKDAAAEDLILTIETTSHLAQLAIPRAVSIALATARDAAERKRLRADLSYAQAEKAQLQAQLDWRSAQDRQNRTEVQEAEAASARAESLLGLAQLERDAADKAMTEIEDGTQRTRIEDAFRSHPRIIRRPDLTQWMEHALSPRQYT